MNRLFVSTVALALLSVPAAAQNPVTKPALSPSQAVLAAWNDVGRKLIAMAEDFPKTNTISSRSRCSVVSPNSCCTWPDQ